MAHIFEFVCSNYPFFFSEKSFKAPYASDFLDDFNLYFKSSFNNLNSTINCINSIALRIFTQLPPNLVNFTFVDPSNAGGSFATFARFIDNSDGTNELINGKFFVDSDDIHAQLQFLVNHITHVLTFDLKEMYKSIQEFNQVAKQNYEPYQFLILNDFPAGINPKDLQLINQIITSGPKCGVYTIIVSNKESRDLYKDQDNVMFKSLLEKFTIIEKYPYDFVISSGDYQFTLKIPPMLDSKEITVIAPIMKKSIESIEYVKIPFDTIISPDKKDWFKCDTTYGISMPIGIQGANEIQYFKLFGTGNRQAHGLIVGQTGSGKSRAIHDIVLSSLIHHSPDELELYFLDFKEGVEAKLFANYQLPHLKVIGLDSEKEFGYSVLKYLNDEIEYRSKIFKPKNYVDLISYRENTKEKMPRILLIMDEFQVLFDGSSDYFTKESIKYLTNIIKQGRAYGIHALLSSQNISKNCGIADDVWSQIGLRIALKCPKNDARVVLSDDNDGVSLISKDNPGQAIYNTETGHRDANVLFRFSYLDLENEEKYLKIIESEFINEETDTKTLLSSIEDNIRNDYNQYINNGINLFKNNGIRIGDATCLEQDLNIAFETSPNSNLLMVSSDEKTAQNMFVFSILSLILGYLKKHNNQQPNYPFIYLIGSNNNYETNWRRKILKNALSILKSELSDFVKYADEDTMTDELNEIINRIENKQETYLMIFGLQNIDLTSNFSNDNLDFYNESSLTFDDHTNKNLVEKILKEGPIHDVHSILWHNDYESMGSAYKEYFPYFALRIGHQLSKDAFANFTRETRYDQITQAIFFKQKKSNMHFRIYEDPSEEWLLKLCHKIKNK